MKYTDNILLEMKQFFFSNNDILIDFDNKTINYNECGDTYYMMCTYSNDTIKSILIHAKTDDIRAFVEVLLVNDDFYDTLDYIFENGEKLEEKLNKRFEENCKRITWQITHNHLYLKSSKQVNNNLKREKVLKMKTETRELMEEWLKENSEERLNICKSINSYDGSMDFSDFTYIEDLSEYVDAYELARSIVYGNVTSTENPVRYNGYANLENVSEYEIEEESENYISEIIDFIDSNGFFDLNCDELEEVYNESEEEIEEDEDEEIEE